LRASEFAAISRQVISACANSGTFFTNAATAAADFVGVNRFLLAETPPMS